MFNWVKSFFSKLFGSKGPIVQVILHDISAVVKMAAPVVEGLAILAKASADKSALISNISKWVTVYQKDAAAVSVWTSQAETLPTSDVLRSAASLAVAALVPSVASSSLINLAIEMAYNIYKAQKAGT